MNMIHDIGTDGKNHHDRECSMQDLTFSVIVFCPLISGEILIAYNYTQTIKAYAGTQIPNHGCRCFQGVYWGWGRLPEIAETVGTQR